MPIACIKLNTLYKRRKPKSFDPLRLWYRQLPNPRYISISLFEYIYPTILRHVGRSEFHQHLCYSPRLKLISYNRVYGLRASGIEPEKVANPFLGHNRRVANSTAYMPRPFQVASLPYMSSIFFADWVSVEGLR